MRLWPLLGASLVLLTAVGCGGARCGDGHVDTGEQCDDGNTDDTDFCLTSCVARTIPRLTVLWSFNTNEALNFDGDSCRDLGVETMIAELSGPAELSAEERCSFRQIVISDLPAGTYTLRLRPVDDLGTLKTAVVYEQEVVFAGGTQTEEVYFPFDGWAESYIGNFFFRTLWGGQDCTTATPAVVQQRVTLSIDNQVVAGAMTTDGASVSGGLSACVAHAGAPQTVLDLPFGPATIEIEGLDIDSEVQFSESFETFIGAGVNNPEMTFDSPPLAVDLDAGVL